LAVFRLVRPLASPSRRFAVCGIGWPGIGNYVLLLISPNKSLRGAPKKKKNESDVYLADDKSGTMLPSFFFNFFNFFYGVFVRFSTRGVQKHHTP
jgi:hypothetical protein